MMKTLIGRGAVFTSWQSSVGDHSRQMGQRRKVGILLPKAPDRTLPGQLINRRVEFSESSLLASPRRSAPGAP